MNAHSRFGAIAVLLTASTVSAAAERAIDVAKSVLTVRVYKSGVFSAFAHDHEIAAAIASGEVDASAHRVELHVKANELRVKDPGASGKERDQIQKTMLGEEVLDAAHYSEIVFRSTAAESTGAGSWRVRGELMLHGQTRPVTVEVTEKGGHYVGSARLKQSEFGIKPIRIAGGTVRVKDEVRIEFDIPARPE